MSNAPHQTEGEGLDTGENLDAQIEALLSEVDGAIESVERRLDPTSANDEDLEEAFFREAMDAEDNSEEVTDEQPEYVAADTVLGSGPDSAAEVTTPESDLPELDTTAEPDGIADLPTEPDADLPPEVSSNVDESPLASSDDLGSDLDALLESMEAPDSAKLESAEAYPAESLTSGDQSTSDPDPAAVEEATEPEPISVPISESGSESEPAEPPASAATAEEAGLAIDALDSELAALIDDEMARAAPPGKHASPPDPVAPDVPEPVLDEAEVAAATPDSDPEVEAPQRDRMGRAPLPPLTPAKAATAKAVEAPAARVSTFPKLPQDSDWRDWLRWAWRIVLWATPIAGRHTVRILKITGLWSAPKVAKGLEVVATPIEKQPPVIRSAVGWIAGYTLFLAIVVWAYLLLFHQTKPPEYDGTPTTLSETASATAAGEMRR